jgi:hypothetical protein
MIFTEICYIAFPKRPKGELPVPSYGQYSKENDQSPLEMVGFLTIIGGNELTDIQKLTVSFDG